MSSPKPLTLAELKRHSLPSVARGDKDRHGQILIIAGSRGVPGAGLLTAHGAMRSGAGKLQLAVPSDIAVQIGIAMPEAMVKGFATARDGGFARRAISSLLELAADADAIVAGPGIYQNEASEKLAGSLCNLGRPAVLDAAVLHALPDHSSDARGSDVNPILLPHAGEMASLLGCARAEVEADPLSAGRACAARYASFVLVKGVQSHIVEPAGHAWKFSGGNPGLGISGSGDVLAGIVGALLARGADSLTALLWGVWLHGEAGRKLGKEVGSVGYLAREIPGQIPGLLRSHGSGLFRG